MFSASRFFGAPKRFAARAASASALSKAALIDSEAALSKRLKRFAF
jgi:hypothetical protein